MARKTRKVAEITPKPNSVLRKWFGDLPMQEAEADLYIIPTDIDISTAVPEDPTHCVFANTCRRMYGAEKGLFWKRNSYVQMPDANGNPTIYRFSNSADMVRLIDNHDRNKHLLETKAATFVLHAPPTSNLLSSRAGYKKQGRSRAPDSKRVRYRRMSPVYSRFFKYTTGGVR